MEKLYESYIQQLLENQERILKLLDEIRINTVRRETMTNKIVDIVLIS